MAVLSIISRGDMPDSLRPGGQVETLSKAGPFLVIRVVNRDSMPTIFLHDGETGNIGRTVPDVDHVPKGDRTNVIRHVIIHVLRHIQQAFVDPEQILGLLSVADY